MSELFNHIAVCVDNSEASTAALDEAWRLRERHECGGFTIVHVIATPTVIAGHGGVWVASPVEIEAGAREWLDELASHRDGATIAILHGDPASAVCDWAADAGVDLIVASSSRGLVDRVLLGSFAGYLARHAPCDVLLTRPERPAGRNGDAARDDRSEVRS